MSVLQAWQGLRGNHGPLGRTLTTTPYSTNQRKDTRGWSLKSRLQEFDDKVMAQVAVLDRTIIAYKAI